jgi:hypothetical protein
MDWCDTLNNGEKYLAFEPRDLEAIKFQAECTHAAYGLNAAVLQLTNDLSSPTYEIGLFEDRKKMCLMVQSWLKTEKGTETMRLEGFQNFLNNKLHHPKANRGHADVKPE